MHGVINLIIIEKKISKWLIIRLTKAISRRKLATVLRMRRTRGITCAGFI